jgi:hypothetical protein
MMDIRLSIFPLDVDSVTGGVGFVRRRCRDGANVDSR